MAEVYPSDNALLNIQSESETGVEYIPSGTAPYYLHFRKLLYRLLLAVRRANDLRVYDEGGLDIGVKSGKFWLGTGMVSYAGSSGNTLVDDKPNIYVYLDSAGSLVTNEYISFPDMATTPHIRLAIVATSNGDIESVTDSRAGHNFMLPYEAGVVTLTLPASAPAGTVFTFAVQAAQELRADPGSSAIRDDSGTTVDKYKSADAIGECITLVADSNGDWATIAKNGTWTEEA
jgi:hypothetical protein